MGYDETPTILQFRFHLPSPQFEANTASDSTLINGLGRYPKGPPSPLSNIVVEPTKKYRFRLISMSCHAYFTFSIDGHSMTIIEADGVNTEPVTVDSIQIFAGQRYSFVLEANAEPGNYWIRAEPEPEKGPPGFLGGINSAILRYAGSESVDPPSTPGPPPKSLLPLKESDLHPLENPGAPGEPYQGGADVVLNLELGLDEVTDKFTINNASFLPPSVPVLLQILKGKRRAQELLPSGSVYVLPPNKVIELSIPARGPPGAPVSVF